MAKSIKSIYFESALLLEAEAQNIDVGAICNEALRIAISKEKGTEGGKVADFIKNQAQRAKNTAIMKKLAAHRDTPAGLEKFQKNLRIYCTEYGLDIAEAIKEIGA